MSVRLYYAEVTIGLYLMASDREAAKIAAVKHAGQAARDADPEVKAREVKEDEEVPADWDGCYPYGDTSATVEKMIAEMREPG